jgi:hypothetical protein
MTIAHIFLAAPKSSEQPEFEFGAPRHRSRTRRSHPPRSVVYKIIRRPLTELALILSASIILWLMIWAWVIVLRR